LTAELEFHLQMEIEQNLQQGMRHEEARDERSSLGGLEQTVEACRDARGTRWLEAFMAGVLLRRQNPDQGKDIYAACVITIALGLGALTSVFSVFHSLSCNLCPMKERIGWLPFLIQRQTFPTLCLSPVTRN